MFFQLTRSVTLSAQNTWSYDFLVDRHNHYVIKVTCEKLGMGKLTLSLKAVENCKDTTVVGMVVYIYFIDNNHVALFCIKEKDRHKTNLIVLIIKVLKICTIAMSAIAKKTV